MKQQEGTDEILETSEDEESGPTATRIPHRIETERLVLRCYEPSDAEALRRTVAENVEHLAKYMIWIRFEPQDLDDKLELILGFRSKFDAGTNHVMGIFERQSGDLVGGTGLHPVRTGESAGDGLEIGYWIARDHEGRGLVTETVKALALVAFRRRRTSRLVIRMDPTNERSEAIPAKLGFTREGVLRKSISSSTGELHDATSYSLLGEELEAAPWLAATEASVRAFDALGREIPLGCDSGSV